MDPTEEMIFPTPPTPGVLARKAVSWNGDADPPSWARASFELAHDMAPRRVMRLAQWVNPF